MKIVVLCEGRTEKALRSGLREFVQGRAQDRPRIGVETRALDGPMMRLKLATLVDRHLEKSDVVGVVAITDVYPDFQTADDAKAGLKRFAGSASSSPKFRAHAAKFEVEAWLMPFWKQIADRLGVKAASPGARPEEINHEQPPSRRLKDLFARAKQRYEKVIDGPRWLTAERLEEAAESCPELKSFLNSLLEFAGAKTLA